MLSLRDKIHSPVEALLKLTLMGCASERPALHVSTLLFAASANPFLRYRSCLLWTALTENRSDTGPFVPFTMMMRCSKNKAILLKLEHI